MKTLRIFLAIFIFFCISGCGTLGYHLIKQGEIDKQIVSARVETQAKLEATNIKEISLLKQKIELKDDITQSASNSLFKASVALSTISNSTRVEKIIEHSVSDTLLLLPPASTVAQQEALINVKRELDESKILNSQLIDKFTKETNLIKTDLSNITSTLSTNEKLLDEIGPDRQNILSNSLKTEQSLQSQKDKVQDAALAQSLEEKARAEDNQKAKMWLMGILGVIALGAGIASAYIPVPTLKKNLVIVAAIAGLACIAIPFIKAWMVMVAILIITIPIAYIIIRNYIIEHRTSTNLTKVIENVKNKAKDTYDEVIKPELQEENQIYLKDGTKVPDVAVQKNIETKLMETGAK